MKILIYITIIFLFVIIQKIAISEEIYKNIYHNKEGLINSNNDKMLLDINKLEEIFLVGRIFYRGSNLEGILVKLESVELNGDTLETISNPAFIFENIEPGKYTLRPISDIYYFDPEFMSLEVYENSIDPFFFADFISSVKGNNTNFSIRENVLYSKEVAGCYYRVIDLQGRVIKSSNLSPTIDFNYLDNGTYILQITKNNSEVFSQKFQVVR